MSKEDDVKLKLIGKNQEDLRTISAYSQDSIVNLKDIVFLKENRTFIMIANRFKWEDVEKGIFSQNRRIRCAIKFEEVLTVKSKNINQRIKNKPLELLTMESKIKNNNCEINFFFSGNSVIILLVEAIDIVMQDLSKPWKVKYVPTHKI